MKEQNTGEVDEMRANVNRALQILNQEIEFCNEEISRLGDCIKTPTSFTDVEKLRSEDLFYRGRLGLAAIIRKILEG